MNPKRWPAILSMSLIVWLLVASVGPQPARAQEGEAGVGPQAVLWNQSNGINTGAISSNLPLYTGGARSALAADDFTVPVLGSNTYWLIESITVYGANTGLPSINGFSVFLYRDGGGLPGQTYGSHFATSFSGLPAPNYVINSVWLLTGNQKYWIGIQANVSSTGTASWSWQSSSDGAGSSESAWIDFGIQGTGGTCYQTWLPRRTVCNNGLQDNMAFRIDGQQVTLPFRIYLPVIRK